VNTTIKDDIKTTER
jgi:chromosome segregation ATPase